MRIEIGSKVIAEVQFDEVGFYSPGETHVHAAVGDRGEVIDVFDYGFMVRWEQTGTACDATEDQISAVENLTATG